MNPSHVEVCVLFWFTAGYRRSCPQSQWPLSWLTVPLCVPVFPAHRRLIGGFRTGLSRLTVGAGPRPVIYTCVHVGFTQRLLEVETFPHLWMWSVSFYMYLYLLLTEDTQYSIYFVPWNSMLYCMQCSELPVDMGLSPTTMHDRDCIKGNVLECREKPQVSNYVN